MSCSVLCCLEVWSDVVLLCCVMLCGVVLCFVLLCSVVWCGVVLSFRGLAWSCDGKYFGFQLRVNT